MFRSRTSDSIKYGVILDIGSGSVGLQIVESDQTKPLPTMIYSYREDVRETDENSLKEENVRPITEALFSAILHLSGVGIKTLSKYNRRAKITDILFTCTSPWAHTISKKIHYVDEEEFIVSEKLLSNLLYTAKEQILTQINEEKLAKNLDLQIVERATVDILINGYHVENLEKTRATDIQIATVTSLVPRGLLEAVQKMQDSFFPKTTLATHTFMFISYCVLRDLLSEIEDFCIVNITNQSTEVAIIKDGILEKTIYSSSGVHILLNEIKKKTKLSTDGIITQLRAYAEGSIKTENLDREILLGLEKYNKTIADDFELLNLKYELPTTIIIIATPKLEGLFIHQVSNLIIDQTKKVHEVFGASSTFHNKTPTNKSEENEDIFLTLAGRFFHKLHNCGETDRK